MHGPLFAKSCSENSICRILPLPNYVKATVGPGDESLVKGELRPRLFTGVRQPDCNGVNLRSVADDIPTDALRVITGVNDKIRNCEVAVKTEIPRHEDLESFSAILRHNISP
jgi:hypothetical protein